MKTIRCLTSRCGTFQVVVTRHNCAYVVHTHRLADDEKRVLKRFPYPPSDSVLPALAHAIAFAHAAK